LAYSHNVIYLCYILIDNDQIILYNNDSLQAFRHLG
jgi:hypothetical protein